MAETVGFEPTKHFCLTIFEIVVLDLSTISPKMVAGDGFEPPTFGL